MGKNYGAVQCYVYLYKGGSDVMVRKQNKSLEKDVSLRSVNIFLDTVIYLSMKVHSNTAYGIIIRIKSPICSPEKQRKKYSPVLLQARPL